MATSFENFVNAELPKRISIEVPPSGNLEPKRVLHTTGNGLQVELGNVDEEQKNFIVNSAETIILDELAENNIRVVKYLFCAQTGALLLGQEILAIRKTNVEWSIYGIVGDFINCLINMRICNGNFIFEVTNNEAVAIQISIKKIAIS